MVLVALWVTVGRPAAATGFSGSRSAAMTVSSATLQPASGLAVTTRCGPLLSLSAQATLSWQVTPSTFAAGYIVERRRGVVLEATTLVTPRTTTTRTETGLGTGTTYTWTVRAYVDSWTSPGVSVSATTPGVCL